MHIIVIGAGIIGMTSAYYLSKMGHQVSVVDACAGSGQMTSKANGAQLSYSFVAPLAEPAVLPKLPAWLLSAQSPLSLRLRADPQQWRWAMAFLAACRNEKSRQTSAELLALGLYSRQMVHQLIADEMLSFDFSSSGKLLVYQDAASYAAARKQMDYQAALGSTQVALDRKRCLELEPALRGIREQIAGGIFTRSEDAGDCLKLCCELERKLRQGPQKVEFFYNTPVMRLHHQDGRVTRLQTQAGDMTADAYVIANGIGAQVLARQAGFNPLIYPLKGYSLTYELTSQSEAPRVSVSDVHNKVVYARLGNRLRVAGMVDIGDSSNSIHPRRIASLKRAVEHYLPALHPADEPVAWAGLRPARPDSKPLIGQTPLRNLWINAGQGALGFTLAAGSAALLANRLSGVPTTVADNLFAP
ncbi:MAG: D-amino acid dehydrogenase [Advenella sp.]|uniref:D-amino acid dehydrogenase small subunit n=1 Tax=Advenella kashmirensis TaxID=310575 RepID=A0A356LLS4_9BURK|nr:D-amino acid dehydrogenase small subunit [Advenella kashmirensis]